LFFGQSFFSIKTTQDNTQAYTTSLALKLKIYCHPLFKSSFSPYAMVKFATWRDKNIKKTNTNWNALDDIIATYKYKEIDHKTTSPFWKNEDLRTIC